MIARGTGVDRVEPHHEKGDLAAPDVCWWMARTSLASRPGAPPRPRTHELRFNNCFSAPLDVRASLVLSLRCRTPRWRLVKGVPPTFLPPPVHAPWLAFFQRSMRPHSVAGAFEAEWASSPASGANINDCFSASVAAVLS
eukprot:scaffold16223_cov27-Tisochrysis_lutea.AAC.1